MSDPAPTNTELPQILGSAEDLLFQPKRLAIISLLYSVGRMTQGGIQKGCGLTWGAVTAHLSKLIKADYVRQRDGFTPRGPRVFVEITPEGIAAYKRMLGTLDNFLTAAREKT